MQCTVEEVTVLLKSLNISKASGPDGISARVLKATASEIAPSITALFNLSLKEDDVSASFFQTLLKRSNKHDQFRTVHSCNILINYCSKKTMFMSNIRELADMFHQHTLVQHIPGWHCTPTSSEWLVCIELSLV